MTVSLAGSTAGSTLTGHDPLYAYPADMETNGTRVPETATDTGLPRITLVTGQRVKWVWADPVRWKRIAIRFSAIPEVAGGGTVSFSFAYRYVTLGSGSVQGAMTATIAIAATAMGSIQFNWNYLLPAEVSNIAVVPGILGDAPFMHCSLTRTGGTLAGGCSIGVTSGTRVPNT